VYVSNGTAEKVSTPDAVSKRDIHITFEPREARTEHWRSALSTGTEWVKLPPMPGMSTRAARRQEATDCADYVLGKDGEPGIVELGANAASCPGAAIRTRE
jgi:hypothetical protein